jgi:hypothetical protein
MLTLQNILDSDSISTLVAKLNANFQAISLSNGGPQGVRGEQGIPGLPGKQGATGPSGPIGATGPSPQIIPFSTTGSLVTPSASTAAFNPPPAYNDRSYEFLTTGPNAWGPWGTGPTSLPVVHGQLYFDNNQLGWWKYLDIPDPTPALEGGSGTAIDGNPSEYYVESPYYSDADGGSWTGPDWYWYPLNTSAIIAAAAGVWVADRTNYLGVIAGSQYNSPSSISDLITQAPFDIENARMASKFGTVWITSFDTDGGNVSSNDTGQIFNWDYLNSPRLNSGIDRSLFKMSIDGPRYFDNMKARGFRTTDSGAIIYVPYSVNGQPVPLSSPPSPLNAGQNQNLFVQPLYNVSIDAYSPIIFYTSRGASGSPVDASTTLGYFQLSPLDATSGSIKIHTFTTRDGIDDFFNLGGTLTSSTNTGEMLFDVRRFITSNQYMNMMPQDTEAFSSLENDPTVASYGPFDTRTGTTIIEWDTDYAWKVYQGYHSVFTGQVMIEGAVAGNLPTYASYENWVYNNRQSWYGTSIFAELPDASDDGVTNTQELVRSAGVMVRGREGVGVTPANVSVDSVIIYTANMPTGPSDYDTAADNNVLQSLPIAYFSPLRNTGIGTVTMDKVGIFEPSARLHVHADWRPANEAQETITNYTDVLESGPYTDVDKSWLSYTTWLPRRRMKAAAFTIERASPGLIYEIGDGGPYADNPLYQTPSNSFADWYNGGVFNDVLFGAVNPPTSEAQLIGLTTSVKSSTAIRYESFVYEGDSSYDFTLPYFTSLGPGSRWGVPVDHYNPDRNGGWYHKGALRIGSSPRGDGSTSAHSTPPPEIGVDANYQSVEFQISFSPLSFAEDTSEDAAYISMSGIGMHSLYPRTRTHFYGKNGYKAFSFDEANTPGTPDPRVVEPSVAEMYPLASNFQISIDYIGDSFKYNAAIFDYAYDYLPTITSIGTYTPWSANLKNYPTRERISTSSTTLGTFNATTNNSNLSLAENAGVGATSGLASSHGGGYNAYFNPNKYIGFNLYRDLLGKGDQHGYDASTTANLTGNARFYANDRYASVWRTGAQGAVRTGLNQYEAGRFNRPYDSNGGAAIMADDDGRLGFAFIAAGRDGGADYGLWEQQGIGQREITNSVKIIFDSDGSIGIGNAPGADSNAYPSLYHDPSTGYINYLGNSYSAVAGENPTATGPLSYNSNPSGLWAPDVDNYYGYGTLMYTGYLNNRATAQINAQATLSEKIRLEVAAEKAQSRIGHHIESRGYGYPGFRLDPATGRPAGSGGVVTIQDDGEANWARRYYGVGSIPATVSRWNNALHTFTFDNLGRIMSYTVDFAAGGWSDEQDILLSMPRATLPHPTEFSSTGLYQPSYNTGGASGYPYFWLAFETSVSYTRSINGTLLGSSDEIWIPTSSAAAVLGSLIYDSGTTVATATFERESLSTAVVRLNNFVLGDGYEFIRSSGQSADVTDVIDASPEATQEIYAARTSSPKLLLTFGAPDYMSMESSAAGLNSTEITNLINAGLAPLMKVTTVIDSAQRESGLRTYTIPNADNTGGTFMVITDHMGDREQDNPGLASLPKQDVRLKIDRITTYEVQRTIGGTTSGQSNKVTPVGSSNYFEITAGPQFFGYEMIPVQYVSLGGVYPHERGIEFSGYVDENNGNDVGAAELTRDLDLYWSVSQDSRLTNYLDENGVAINENASDIRYRRINDNYVLFDFNITLDVNQVVWTLAQNGNIGAPFNSFSGLTYMMGSDGAEDAALTAYTHSPFAAGTLSVRLRNRDEDELTTATWHGIDARWIQYVRIAYNIGEDNDFESLPGQADPNFYENQYGGGANFVDWGYRGWHAGSAVVGSAISGRDLDTGNQFDLVTDDYNFWDNAPASPTQNGWNPYNLDNSPYMRSGSVTTDNKNDATNAKSWNGRFTDWYYGTYSTGASGNAQNKIFNWGTFAYRTAVANNTNVTIDANIAANYPTGITEYDDPSGGANNNRSDFGANPWITTFNDAEEFPDNPGFNQWFKRSNINRFGYQFLMKGWYQWIGQINSTYPDSSILPVAVPQYFDAVVWRSFGDEAWNREANFQWRIVPYNNNPNDQGATAGTVSNTIAIEIMFDKPIYVSGAERVMTLDGTNFLDRLAFPEYVTDDTSTYYKWQPLESELSTAGTPATRRCYNQSRFFINQDATNLSIFRPAMSYKPHGSISLRGQSITRYQKRSVVNAY